MPNPQAATQNKSDLRGIFVAAAIGGFVCVLADFLKVDGSLINRLTLTLFQSYGIPKLIGLVILLVFLPALSTGLCFVLEPNKRYSAFVMGASVLSLVFNFVPIENFPQLKNYQNSTRVVVELSNRSELQGRTITVTMIAKDNSIVGQSRYSITNEIFFYVDDGDYRMVVEMSGYEVVQRPLKISGEASLNVPITLVPSAVPRNVQKLFF